MVTEVLPQPANGRFATVEKCSLCDYARYDYTAAKAVIADYYGVVDGKPHTIAVSDLSEAGVRTAIRYGNSADMLTALNIGDACKADCKVEKINSFYDVLKRTEMLTVNVEELNYLAKRLDTSFPRRCSSGRWLGLSTVARITQANTSS